MALTKVTYSMIKGEVVNVLDYDAVGDGVADDTDAIDAANTAAAANPYGATVYFPAGVYKTTAEISIPNQVSWLGEGYPQTNTAGTVWDNGAVIYKAHDTDAVSMKSNNNAGMITNIGIWSDKATWTTGDGFVIGPATGCILTNCTVRAIGGDAFVIGDGTADSYTNCCFDCYSNNVDGRGFVINNRYFRGYKLISDGGTIGIDFVAGANGGSFSSIGECMFEGFTQNGIKIDQNDVHTWGRNATVTYAGVSVAHVYLGSNAIGCKLSGITTGSSSTSAGSYGVHFASGANRNVLRDSYLYQHHRGVLDAGNYNVIDGCVFELNEIAYEAAGDLFTFVNNNTFNSTLYSIIHSGGTRGVWGTNILDKTINPALTGVQGDFSGIKVKDNVGYVSSTVGQTGGIAVNTAVPHGLAGVPSPDITLTCYTTGVTSQAQITTQDATNIAFNWSGNAPAQWGWKVHLPCDFQHDPLPPNPPTSPMNLILQHLKVTTSALADK